MTSRELISINAIVSCLVDLTIRLCSVAGKIRKHRGPKVLGGFERHVSEQLRSQSGVYNASLELDFYLASLMVGYTLL